MIINRSVPTSPRKCSSCKATFEGSQTVFSALYESDKGKWERSTWCEQCAKENIEKGGWISTWKTTFSKKEELTKIPHEALIDLLDRAVESDTWRPIAALLAWHLVRKKYLKYLKTELIDGEEFLRFSLKGSDREKVIPNSNPTEKEITAFHDLLALIEEIEG